MKYILMFLVVVMVREAAATECSKSGETFSEISKTEIKTDVPRHLEGATITVRLADGTESTVPASKFKVVARKQQFITTHIYQVDTLVCKEQPRKNRVSASIGQGPKGTLGRDGDSNKTTIESQVGALGGAQYQRLVTERVSVGVQVQSNETTSVNLGWDF